MLDLIGANNFSVSDANFTSIRNAVNVSGGKFLFDRLTFMEMTSYLNITQNEGENMTVAKLLQSVDAKLMVGIRISKQPVAFAAFMKNLLLPQVLPMYLIDLGVKVTGLTEPIIRKLYNMSDVDFGNAKVLPFGGLPAYVNQTMNVLFDIKQFNTLSLDSLTRAMLIHKNHTEGTIDFIKDFGFIARNVSIGTIKTIYNINSAMFNSSSLFTLSNLISGINYIQLQMVLHDRSALNLKGVTIGEMADYLKLNVSELDKLSIAGLRDKFSLSVSASIALSLQSVAIAAYAKGITVNQIVLMNVIDLGVRVTGFTEPIIRKLYNMSDVDFGNAKVLPFGGLPAYVNQTMNVLFDIKQFNTLSLDSLTRAMLIHKNHTEGTLDFIKDFGFIARTVAIGKIKLVYNMNTAILNSSSLFTLSNLISGITHIQLQMVLHDRSALNLKGVTIGEMADYLKLNVSELDKLSIAGLRDKFSLSVSASIALSLQSVAIAAYAKGITVNQIVLMNVIDLGVRVTGFTEPIIRKLYNMSDVDFGNAKVLPFGGLPAYVNQTMNVLFDIKQFNTLSLDSLTRAMLIHKNHTEGTIDFIKDFRFIARNVSIGKIKLVYNMNTAILNSSSLFTLSNLISGITYVQLQMVLHDRSALNLKGVTIGEMADYLKLNVSELDKLSIAGLRDKFNLSVSASIALSLQPVAVAAYKKGIMLNQIAIIGVVDLAARVTGFTVPLIQKVYNISDVDFGNAMRLVFGGIPEYVLRSIGVQFQLKHFYVMSLKSIYNAFIIHKNIVLGTIDFRKDFNVLASSMSIRDLSKIFFFNIQLIKQKTIPEFLDLIAGTNITVVFNYNVQETAAISSFTFEEGLYFLRSRARELQLDRMPLNHFIGAIIEQFKVVPQLFVPLDTLAVGNLMQISILQLTKLGNLTQPGLHRLLNSSFISVRYFERIKGLTLGGAFAKGIFSIATENVGRRTLMKFLQSIRGVKGKLYQLYFCINRKLWSRKNAAFP